jgi:EAL domain-containing protein (putative c-di-GMP-specific phosphodiesterase class I)
LSYLHRFPVDTLKIDRSFVSSLAGRDNQPAIIESIVALARTLGTQVIAEGVETTEQDAFLRRHGCDEVQGYLFSKPLPSEEFPFLFRLRIYSPPLQPELASPASTRRRDSGQAMTLA